MSLLAVVLSAVIAPGTVAPPRAPLPVRADSFVIEGRITHDQSRRPLAGANISVIGLGAGTMSSADGRYRLGIARTPGLTSVRVRVRLLGFTPAEKLVAVTPKQATVDFTLAPAVNSLEQVVVTAAERKAERRELGMAVAAAPSTADVARASGAVNMAPPPMTMPPSDRLRRPSAPWNREQYASITENPFLAVARTPLSTFAIDVDRASYANVRRFLESGARPPRDAVRIEELVNYFHYDYAAPPRTGAPLDVTVETHPAPWQPSHRLVRIGMQAQRLPVADLPAANLVFLVDVSGSMQHPAKLPLVKQSLRLLAQELRPQDRVAIAVYAGAAGLVLPSTSGREKERILDALERLEAGGSTNGAAGIRLAYQTARANFLEDGANR
ncbi:MAG: von Willebrand factor type A domain-containing protein, partial [Gemmatimonadaceae bacterium]|nr:von Willebrand factor type A domain-containing protein [Gemmatimonadaceae bacterium]